jgi:hypothetical protein
MVVDLDHHERGASAHGEADILQQLGIPAIVADLFGDRIDWHEVANLVARGCTPGLALEILR